MTRNLLNTLILWIVCSILVFFCFIIAASAQQDAKRATRPAHLGFIYPLSTNGAEASQLSNRFSLHMLAGVSRNEEAFCLSGISSVIKEDATGVVISGIYTHVGDTATGAQISGLVNMTGKEAKGLQMAGLANIAGNTQGMQLAGFTNISGNVDGAQIAGFANCGKDADVQIAGFANTAKKSHALQLSGFINVSKDAGSQISGFINVAGKVKGVQIAGLLNIAEESDYPIGLINIVKNGERQIGVGVDETGTSLLSFRSGGKVLYGILGIGYNFKDADARYVLEGGMGAHFSFNKYFRTNLEITSSALTDFNNNVYMKSTTRLLAAVKIVDRIEFFAGPSFNYLGYERGQSDIRNDRYLWKERTRDHFNGLYVGLTGGVQVSL